MQGFSGNDNNFIPKEVTLYYNGISKTFLFKPPYPWQDLNINKRKSVCWVTKNLHGLQWEDGKQPYKCLFDILNSFVLNKVCNIYTKGSKKAKFLRNLLKCNIIDIGELGCCSLYDEKAKMPDNIFCYHHINNNKYCAKLNAYKLAEWLHEHCRNSENFKVTE